MCIAKGWRQFNWQQCVIFLIKIINHEWPLTIGKYFTKSKSCKWRYCSQLVLPDLVMPTETKPTNTYMTWYRSVVIEFASEDRYLYDPRQTTYTQEVSSSNHHNISRPLTHHPRPNQITDQQTLKHITSTCQTPNYNTKSLLRTTTDNTQGTYNTNTSSYHSQNAKRHITKTCNKHGVTKHHNNYFFFSPTNHSHIPSSRLYTNNPINTIQLL